MYSGVYTLTVYVSLLRHDPLLLASITNFHFNLIRILESNQPTVYDRETLTTTENKVL